MITIVWGKPGAGKSTYAVLRAMQEREKVVLANFHSVDGLWEFASWEDMQGATNAVCVVDEAHMWFSARQWQKNSVDDLGTFMQSRKSGLDLVIVVQHPDRLDTAIREVAHNYVECLRFGGLNTCRLHWDWKEKGGTWKIWVPTQKIFKQFFTTEIISTREKPFNRLGLNARHVQLAYRATDLIERATLGHGSTVWLESEEEACQYQERPGWKVDTMALVSGRWVPLPGTLVPIRPTAGRLDRRGRLIEMTLPGVGLRPRLSNTGSARPKENLRGA